MTGQEHSPATSPAPEFSLIDASRELPNVGQAPTSHVGGDRVGFAYVSECSKNFMGLRDADSDQISAGLLTGTQPETSEIK